MLTTWKFRIKDSGFAKRRLRKIVLAVNTVWNYCKDTQIQALKRTDSRQIIDKDTGKVVAIPNFFSKYEMNNLVSGSSKLLGIHSQTVQFVCEEYVTRRKQYKKLLRWRGRKHLGWIPFKGIGVSIEGDSIVYCKERFRYWRSRQFPEDAKIKTGSFVEDRRGRWYFSVTFESEELEKKEKERSQGQEEIGIDLGVKRLATLSNGQIVMPPELRKDQLDKIRRIERQRKARRRKQSREKRYSQLPKERELKKLHAVVSNKRKDFLHKSSREVIAVAKVLAVGALSCGWINRNRRLSGKSLDNGIGMFKNMLRYKADRAGVVYIEVCERDSTQQCSECGWKPPPSRLIGLGVRKWTCPECGVHHDRDHNSSKNHLRLGRQTLTRSAA